MSLDYGETPDASIDNQEPVEEKKDRTLWIIIAVILVVLCCGCLAVVAGAWWLWNNGDALFGLSSNLGHILML